MAARLRSCQRDGLGASALPMHQSGEGSVRAACVDAGNTLASCGGDKQVRIWQRFEGNSGTGGAARWACAAVLEEGHNRTVRAVPAPACQLRLVLVALCICCVR
jgi:hypothetical protein